MRLLQSKISFGQGHGIVLQCIKWFKMNDVNDKENRNIPSFWKHSKVWSIGRFLCVCIFPLFSLLTSFKIVSMTPDWFQ